MTVSSEIICRVVFVVVHCDGLLPSSFRRRRREFMQRDGLVRSTRQVHSQWQWQQKLQTSTTQMLFGKIASSSYMVYSHGHSSEWKLFGRRAQCGLITKTNTINQATGICPEFVVGHQPQWHSGRRHVTKEAWAETCTPTV